MAKFITDGAVELYHNHIKKFETTALGIDVTGNIDASSHITASGNISSSGTFTSDGVNSSAAVLPVTSNGAALGSTSLQWSDLFLASGGVINFNNGDITLTHSATAQQLKLNGGSLNVNSNITASGDISSSLASTGSFGALHTTGDISGSGTGSFSNIKVSNMPAGADNSVVILDSDGFLKTDEVDSRIFDGTNLLGAQSSPTDGYFLISDDGRSLADSIMNQDSSNIGIGIATPEQKLTVHGNISSSGTIFANDYGGNVSGSLTSTGSFGKGFFDGRVGINDNTPGFQLDVNGTFRSTGYARADGGVYANDFFHAIGGDGFTFDSHITASGDISASGNYIGDRQFDKTSNTDADARGDIVYIGGTTSMDNGKIYHYKSDGTWELADADAVANCDGLLAVALGAASDTNGMLLRGTVTLDHDPGAVGDVLFLATGGTGQATATAPSGNTDIVRVIGYCLDASNGQIWFNPDNTFVEVSA